MKTFNRRHFVSLITSGAMFTILLPQLGKSLPPPPSPTHEMYPFVEVLSNDTVHFQDGTFALPSNIAPEDAQTIMEAFNTLPVNGMLLIPAAGSNPTELDMEAAQRWANEYAPTVGVGGAAPQVVMEIALGIVILVVGGLFIYWICKKIDQWITPTPAPNTNNSPAIVESPRPRRPIKRLPIMRRSPALR